MAKPEYQVALWEDLTRNETVPVEEALNQMGLMGWELKFIYYQPVGGVQRRVFIFARETVQ